MKRPRFPPPPISRPLLSPDKSKKSGKVNFLFEPMLAGDSRGDGRGFDRARLLWRWCGRVLRGMTETLTGAPSCVVVAELSDCTSMSSSGYAGPAEKVKMAGVASEGVSWDCVGGVDCSGLGVGV